MLFQKCLSSVLVMDQLVFLVCEAGLLLSEVLDSSYILYVKLGSSNEFTTLSLSELLGNPCN